MTPLPVSVRTDSLAERGGFDLQHSIGASPLHESLNGKGPSPFEPGPSSHVVAKLLLDLGLPRPCRRPIAFTETIAASPIPPSDETRSQVLAPAIAANQLV